MVSTGGQRVRYMLVRVLFRMLVRLLVSVSGTCCSACWSECWSACQVHTGPHLDAVLVAVVGRQEGIIFGVPDVGINAIADAVQL